MLSVFITPWMKPTSSQRATSSACRAMTRFEQRAIGALGLGGLRVVPGDDVVGEQPHALGVAARGEILEGADADVAGRRRGSAPRRAAASRACTRSPVVTAASARVVGMPSAAMASLTMYSRSTGPERGAAVAAARERRRAGALELDVAAHAVAVDDLAEQDRAAVAELRHEMAELVAGIGHRDRLGALGNALAGQDLDALRARRAGRDRGRAGPPARGSA